MHLKEDWTGLSAWLDYPFHLQDGALMGGLNKKVQASAQGHAGTTQGRAGA